ncbi:MAG: insulinase family protein [Oscillospiraceae bacterium]|nr:insulinase family protein [Oscillospiraceae bacterium]
MDILNRKEIAPGIFLSRVTDPRFKQNRISVSFMTQLSQDNASLNAVIPKILTNSCRLYPDLRSLNAKLSALYAARLSGSTGSIGDTQEIGISIKTIDSRYALENEDVAGEAVKILTDCIFEPLTENGAFKASVTETEKQACIDQIEAELNDKRVYAVRRASELLFKGEPAAVQSQGTIEGVKAVTPESAYQAYQSLLKTARIEIICAGCNDFSTVTDALTNSFGKIERGQMEDCHSNPAPIKPQMLTHSEEMDVNQSKMVLGFKSTSEDMDALVVMAKIYGGSATSKLFENVREKMSLCYYCWAKFYQDKRVIVSECGVEKDNIEKAKTEIIAQLNLMKESDFTDEDINHALLSLQNDLKLVNDSLRGIKSWYLSHIYRCDIIMPEQAIKRYESVTRERIVNAAKSLTLDTVYILTENFDENGGAEING